MSLLNRILRNTHHRHLWQLIRVFCLLPLQVIASAIPKQKDLFVFAHHLGYGDNARTLAEYMSGNPNFNVVWIGPYKQKDAIPDSIGFASKWSLKGLYWQCTAKTFFASTGISELGPLVPRYRVNIFQLWHGWPIKSILFESEETFTFGRGSRLRRLEEAILTHNTNRYRAIFCHDTNIAQRFANAFRVPSTRLDITGWPRLERCYSAIKPDGIRSILIAPTWHSNSVELMKALSPFCNTIFRQFVASNNLIVTLKLHPLNHTEYDTITALMPYASIAPSHEDISEHIQKSDCFITDFSSAAVDAMIKYNKHLIIATPNFERYTKTRGVHPSFDELFGRFQVTSTSEIIDMLLHPRSKTADISTNTNACANIVNSVQSYL